MQAYGKISKYTNFIEYSLFNHKWSLVVTSGHKFRYCGKFCGH